MRVIFLDIDGVLNNNALITLLGDVIGLKQLHALTQAVGEIPFDEESCSLVRKLVEETKSKVVLSSTWRLNTKSREIIKKFADIDIYDITPRIFDKRRGHEIKKYLDKHKDITNYVILDDDCDMLRSQKANFVHVSNLIGFTYEDYQKAKEILLRSE